MNDDKALLLNYFSPTDKLIIFDIGACELEDSIGYAQMFPYSLVYAFEPINSNANICRSKRQDRIFVFQIALSDRNGQQEMYVSSGCPEGKENEPHNYGNKSSSLLRPDKHLDIHKWCQFEKKEMVETQTLDRFCRDANVDHIDYIHIDVQAAEMLVLKGQNILDTVKGIYIEVSRISMYENQPLQNEVGIFLESKGFIKVMERNEGVQSDELWIRKELIK